MADVTVRPATAADEQPILELMRDSLGESAVLRRTSDLLRWKHAENPFGSSIMLIAEIGGEVAGFRAFMRWELVSPTGHIVNCVRAVDTATHPRFQRKGVFRELTMNAVDIARAEGVDLIFNTPNPKSAAGYFKMGWREVGWIGVMVRPRVGRALRHDENSLPSISLSLPSAEEIPKTFPSDRAPLGLRTKRDSEYLTWRFRDHPTASYGWVSGASGSGAIVRASYRHGRSETVLSDLIGTSEASVIRAAARRSRSRYMASWFTPESPERLAALRAGLLPIPGFKTLRLVARPLTELDIDVHRIASWDFSVGDMELL